MMIVLNHFETLDKVPAKSFAIFLALLAPFAPHLAAELAEERGISLDTWPEADKTKLQSAVVRVAVQINGKVRATIELLASVGEEEVLAAARADENVQKWLALGKEARAVYVPGKVINFVVR